MAYFECSIVLSSADPLGISYIPTKELFVSPNTALSAWTTGVLQTEYLDVYSITSFTFVEATITDNGDGTYTFYCKTSSYANDFDISEPNPGIDYPTMLVTGTFSIPFQFISNSSTGLVLNTETTPNKNGTGTFIETTLTYSGTNTHGWGTPNPEIADATEASLTIYLPNTTTLLPDSTTSVVIDLLTEDFPNTDYTPYIITNEILGGDADTRIPDGIYQFDYLVYVNDTDAYTHSSYVLFDSNVNCCIANLAETVDATKCGCGKAASKFEKASLALTAARFAMDCPNITNAAKNLRAAIEICDGCTNC